MGATRATDLDTPVVTIDLDLMEHTIRRTQDYFSTHGIAFRPHIKTHKIPAIAHLQVGAGARGITCQKLGEAEVFLAAGLRDILIPYNIVGEEKVARLCRLARQASSGNEPGQITVSVDSATAAEGISRGANRAGVEIGLTDSITALRKILRDSRDSCPTLQLQHARAPRAERFEPGIPRTRRARARTALKKE